MHRETSTGVLYRLAPEHFSEQPNAGDTHGDRHTGTPRRARGAGTVRSPLRTPGGSRLALGKNTKSASGGAAGRPDSSNTRPSVSTLRLSPESAGEMPC